ncbi:MAG TPA: hypothetical protein VGD54_11790, partial [Steroidobacteraceae bacterium]
MVRLARHDRRGAPATLEIADILLGKARHLGEALPGKALLPVATSQNSASLFAVGSVAAGVSSR